MTRLFGLWADENAMPDIRRRSFDTFDRSGLTPTLVTLDTMADWVVPAAPIHAAFPYLSAVHRSDYLRAYLMFHHGGGYSDIKQQSGNWVEAVEAVDANPRLAGSGYPEIYGGTVCLQHNALLGRYHFLSYAIPRLLAWPATYAIRAGRRLLIGNGAFYFKANTSFGRSWLTEVERRLDIVLPALRLHPAASPRAQAGDGSGYPLPWTCILGDILHPLTLCHWRSIARTIPAPDFKNYR